MNVAPKSSVAVASAVVGLLVFLSWFTISASSPKIYAPLNLAVLLPSVSAHLLFSSDSTGLFAVIAGDGFIPALFCIWCLPLFRGRETLPVYSLLLLAVAMSGSALLIAVGFPSGVRYQGPHYTFGIALANLLCWTLLVWLAVRAWRRPSYDRNLSFHIALFSWLAWLAFPYMGELP